MIEPEPTEQPPKPERKLSQAEVAAMIADELGETEEPVRKKIVAIVYALGRRQSRQLLNHALQMEEHGGEMLPDGSRRRTPGGVFFNLAYTIGQPKRGRHLPLRTKPKKQTSKAKKPDGEQASATTTQKSKKVTVPSAPPEVSPFLWDDRRSAIEEAQTEKGQISTVKITIIGRPGKIIDKGTCIVTVMEESRTPALPKGLPTPTSTPTKYAVYIASKQWAKVKEAIADPDDVLIVEGFPKTDAQVSAIAVFATNVTTKKFQMSKKQPKETPA